MDAVEYARMLRHRELIELAERAERRVDPWLAGRWRLPGLWRLPGRWRVQGLWGPCGSGVVLHRDLLLVPRSAGRGGAVAGSAGHASRCAGLLILGPVWNANVLDRKVAALG